MLYLRWRNLRSHDGRGDIWWRHGQHHWRWGHGDAVMVMGHPMASTAIRGCGHLVATRKPMYMGRRYLVVKWHGWRSHRISQKKIWKKTKGLRKLVKNDFAEKLHFCYRQFIDRRPNRILFPLIIVKLTNAFG
jgi:hypothetical protein